MRLRRALSTLSVLGCLLALSAAPCVLAEEFPIDVQLGGVGFDMEVDVARGLLYASVPSLNKVVVITTDTFEVYDNFVVGDEPRGIDLSDDGESLFVALNGSGAVAVVDLSNYPGQAVPAPTLIPVAGASGTQSSLIHDVMEVQPSRLLVTAAPGSGGLARVAQVELSETGYTVSTVADNRYIRANPVLAVDPAREYAYVGEGFSPNSLYKLDLAQPDAPRVLEDDHGSVSGTDFLALSDDGSMIFLSSGQALRTSDFTQAGQVSSGIPRFSEAFGGTVYVAEYPDYGDDQARVGVYDTTTFVRMQEIELPCLTSYFSPDRHVAFEVLPGDSGWLILTADSLCGLVSGDAAALDVDGDGVLNSQDNCPDLANPGQENEDGDEFGDPCDPYPADPDNLMSCLVELDDNLDQLGSLVTENDALQTTNDALTQENNALQTANGALTQENDALQSANDALAQQNETLSQEVADLQDQIDNPAEALVVQRVEWLAGRRQLRVDVVSSRQPGATLTVEGFGEMVYKSGRFRYELRKKPVDYPASVTITSSEGGSITVSVVQK